MSKGFLQFPKGVHILLINSLLMSLSFYSLIPYISYYLSVDLMWTPFLIGLLLMTRQVSQQGLTFFTGMIADRLGYKIMLTIGLMIRGIGFSLFAFVEEPIFLFLAAIIAGVGGSIFEPTSSAALSTLTTVAERSRIYSIKKVMGNIGIGLAALLSAILINYDFMLISIVCGGIFVLASLITYTFMPNMKVQVDMVPVQQMVKTVIRDRYFVLFTVVTIGFYFMYMQMFLTIPLQVVELTNQPHSVSAVYLVFALLIIIGQYPINRFTARFDMLTNIKWGLALMGIGLITLGTSGTIMLFVLGLLIFVVGIMVTEPTTFDFISRLADAKLMASYFGFASIALAVGGGLSQGAGGYLFQVGKQIGFPTLLWWIAGLVALLSIIGIKVLETREDQRVIANQPSHSM